MNSYEKEIDDILKKITPNDKKLFDNIKDEIYTEIKKENKKSKKKPFFDFTLLTESKSCKEMLFKGLVRTFIFIGDRNIGKSTSMLRMAFNQDKPFIVIRSQIGEVDALVKMDDNFKSSETQGVKKIADGTYMIFNKEDKSIICYLTALSAGAGKKSIPFNEIGFAIYDEFASNKKKDKYEKLTQFISTVQRHNKDFYMLLAGNYDNTGDTFLDKFGQQYKTNLDEFVVDWVAGSIIWNIPKNIFKAFKNKKNLGYRMSLKDKELWTSQYGGGYSYVNEHNILLDEEVKDMEPFINIVLPDGILSLFICNRGKYILVREHNDLLDIPYLCFFIKEYLSNPKYELVPFSRMEKITKLWKDGIVYCQTTNIRDRFRMFLSVCLENIMRGL